MTKRTRPANPVSGSCPRTRSADRARDPPREPGRLTERIDVLTRNRDAVAAYLDELRQRAH
ncbi:hypothetical protein POF50_015465 [Streptomyces sp. SL13]|uniref:Uncharacterized protein n=1 Tax=Streptantibioticus silvisoli TaxID=2705255 RepID=A0AA90H4M8_9ACTN|nr:hypothetical protein [Streptantibioticus silvisoli]MDI5970720.1 hypothetical protein [Streptantibioticus silvisoli]